MPLAFALVNISGAVAASTAKAPPWVKNCTALNKKYPHGIGKAKARDPLISLQYKRIDCVS